MTKSQLREYIERIVDPELVEETLGQCQGWLDRGDGVAVYENHELGHPRLGDVQIVSYGGPEAQLEVGEGELPKTLPDIGGRINWRYQLVGYYRNPKAMREVTANARRGS